jgi:hypothetical protein
LPAPRINQYYKAMLPADSSSVSQLHAQVRNLERTLRTRMSELQAADRHIAALEDKPLKLKEVSREVKQLKQEKQILRKSPERRIGQILLAPYRLPQKLIRALRSTRQQNKGVMRSASALEYQRWFEKHRASPKQLAAMRAESHNFLAKPLISVITPVFNTPVAWLKQTIQSVLAQAYENWELILVVFKQSGVTRNYSCVTAACLLTRRDVFKQVGGFDQRLPLAFYDVDFCLKLRRARYLIVYTPFAKLYHHDTGGRATPAGSLEGDVMRKRWPELLQRDPYYNSNFSRERADFSLGNRTAL